MPVTEAPHWVGVPEAARLLGVRPSLVYNLIRRGELPAYRFGGSWRLKRIDVQVFIQLHRVRPGSLRGRGSTTRAHGEPRSGIDPPA